MPRRAASSARGSKSTTTLKTNRRSTNHTNITKFKARKSIAIPRTSKKAAVVESDAESTSSGEESVESNEESDLDGDDSDEASMPKAHAPSRLTDLKGEMGPKYDDESDNLSDDETDNDEWSGFPVTTVNLEAMPEPEIRDIDTKLFESDDDVFYERVNEVSDSEDGHDDAALQRTEEALLLGEFNNDLTSYFANQIDGMSAYGFGSDSEASVTFPFSESDDAFDMHTRRVHFREPTPVMDMAARMNVLADSPTMTRALLPSALPAEAEQDNLGTADEGDDGNDTDATEQLEAPEEAWRPATARKDVQVHEEPASSSPSQKRSPIRRGPVRGTFIDDGDKTVGYLDSTGTKLVIEDAHLLGGVFAKRYGPSAPGSPSVGFAEAVFTSTTSSRESSLGDQRPASQPLPVFDSIFTGVDTQDFTRFVPPSLPTATTQSSLNEFVSGELFDDPAEAQLSLEDMICFDDASDTDGPDSPFVSNYSQALSMPATPLSHMNSMNVSAFRSNTLSSYSPAAPWSQPLRNKFTTPLKKRKKHTKNDSPYNDAHYKGVTPVQRVSYAEHAEISSSSVPGRTVMGHKRRRTMV